VYAGEYATMATIRVRDWTKKQIEKIAEGESHSSHDSVIKSLLKDREMAQFATQGMTEPEPDTTAMAPLDKPIDGLTVLAELTQPENGVLFLWCPNCENEIAHLTVDTPIGIEVFEVECQHCLTQLDQHGIVAIELSYPIEEQLVEETLLEDLKTCTIDYWNRALEQAADRDRSTGDPDDLVWRIDQYVREFEWEWPTNVPVVSFEVGTTYKNTRTNERIEVIETASENRSGVDSYRVQRTPIDNNTNGETDVLDDRVVCEMLLNRNLIIDESD
jgi:hypothetical protein